MDAHTGKLRWTLTTADGKLLTDEVDRVKIPAHKSARALRLELADPIAEYGADNLLLFVELSIRDEVISSNVAMFDKPKRMNLVDPKISTKVNKLPDGAFLVTVKAKKPALWTWLELDGLDARMDCNFFHLAGTTQRDVVITPADKLTKQQFTDKLIVRSLIDTYRT